MISHDEVSLIEKTTDEKKIIFNVLSPKKDESCKKEEPDEILKRKRFNFRTR